MRTPAAWWRSCKRRRPGIYVFRTRRHRAAGTEWGYVGKSRNLAARKRDHEGTGAWGSSPKAWIDLVASYWALRLPWWLGWNWVLGPLEALTILALRPRYNWQLNPRRSKVGPRGQAIQRLQRDMYGNTPTTLSRVTDIAVRARRAVLILGGLAGWLAVR
jgi:hypothetical protein